MASQPVDLLKLIYLRYNRYSISAVILLSLLYKYKKMAKALKATRWFYLHVKKATSKQDKKSRKKIKITTVQLHIYYISNSIEPSNLLRLRRS